MERDVFDKAEKIFFDTCEKEINKVAFGLSTNIEHPKIEYVPMLLAQLPLPTEKENDYSFYDKRFTLDSTDTEPIWNLFLVSIYHTAAHISISDFSIYEEWKKDKNENLAQRAINFVEDIRANAYLQSFFPEIWESIQKINSYFDTEFYEKTKPIQEESKTEFKDFFNLDKGFEKDITEKIIQVSNDEKKTLDMADYLYHNKNLLPSYEYPYCDQLCLGFQNYPLPKNGFDVIKDFKKTSVLMQELWIDRESKRLRILKRYKKHVKDLEFDDVVFNPQNFKEYYRLRQESSLLIKKIKNQLQTVSNIIDEPTSNDLGLMELQKAIQAVSSKNPSISIFEQDEERRYEESWAIVMDTSASMKVSFKEFKKFALCLSEAADTLNSRYGKWAMYCYDNRFYIVKDGNERYNQEIKSRVGGIENQGLSFIPDAITLTTRLMKDEVNDRKFIFLISDGRSLGYDKINKKFVQAMKFARENGIKVVGIGVPEELSKFFTVSFSESETRKAVANFINAYIYVAKMDM